MDAREIAAGLTQKQRELLAMGDDLRLFLPFKKTKILVGETFFKRGVLVDSSYQDFASLKEEALSDMPAMKRLEELGLVGRPQADWVAFSQSDGTEWRWKRTDLGRQVSKVLSPDAD